MGCFRVRSQQFFHTRGYFRYQLELDQGGDVLGGKWITENRPDFLWVQQKPAFRGYFENMTEIYEAAITEQ